MKKGLDRIALMTAQIAKNLIDFRNLCRMWVKTAEGY
jgi:hypothetical protein